MKNKVICLLMAAMLVLSGCAQKKNDTAVANVGDKVVTLSEFEFYLNNVKQQMQGTELSSDEDWQTKDINGKKAIEVAKEQALDIAAKNIAYKIIYEKLGNTITDSDRVAIEQSKTSIVSQYDSNGGYDEFLKQSNISDEFIDMLCESMYCSELLYTDFSSGIEVSDEEVGAFYNEHFDEYFAPYRRAKHVLILTQDEETQEAFSEEKKAEAKAKAEEILQRAKSGENFDGLVSKFSQDPGSATSPEGYTFTDGEMVQEFENCVDSLKSGEIGFCETSYGYHIVKRLDVDMNYFAESIRSTILSEKFLEYIENKMTEYGIVIEELEAIKEAL